MKSAALPVQRNHERRALITSAADTGPNGTAITALRVTERVHAAVWHPTEPVLVAVGGGGGVHGFSNR
jgi:hypothetical protein